jgi:hypothetical protein
MEKQDITEFESYKLIQHLETTLQDVFDWFEDHPEASFPAVNPHQAAVDLIRDTLNRMMDEQ